MVIVIPRWLCCSFLLLFLSFFVGSCHRPPSQVSSAPAEMAAYVLLYEDVQGVVVEEPVALNGVMGKLPLGLGVQVGHVPINIGTRETHIVPAYLSFREGGNARAGATFKGKKVTIILSDHLVNQFLPFLPSVAEDSPLTHQ
jgi:hypothetical protein